MPGKIGWKPCILSFFFVFTCSALQAQIVRHAYRFNNNLKASEPDCGPDLIQSKAPGLCLAGNVPGAFITDSLPLCQSRRTVYHTNLQWGLMYPNADNSISKTYTIHMYVKVTAWGYAQWVRIIDFYPNSSYDRGIYFKLDGSGKFCLDFWPKGIIGPCPYFDKSTYYLLSFTRNGATGQIDVYVNGTLFSSYNDQGGDFVARSGMPVYIFRDDQYIACESGEANFAYLSFANSYSSQTDITSVYNNICSISKPNTVDFNFAPSTICSTRQNTTVTYTGNITQPAIGYAFNWDWDGGNIISGSGIGPYVVNWSSAGVKNVKLTITGGTCIAPVTNTIPISVGSAGIQQSIQPATCTGNGMVTLTASGGTAPYTYSTDGINYQNTNSFRVSQGTYTMYAKDAGSCIVKTSALVPFLDDLAVRTGADTVVCQGTPVKLFTASNGSSFSWQPAAGLDNPALKEPVATPMVTTSYTVTATAGACMKKDTVVIMVSPPMQISLATEKANCAGNGRISVTATGGTPPYQYSLDGATYQNSNSFALPQGAYAVAIRDVKNCTATASATVEASHKLYLLMQADTMVCAGQAIQLHANSNATSFSWQPASGLNRTDIKDPIAKPGVTTDYIVTVTDGGCTKKDTVTVTVSPQVLVIATADTVVAAGVPFQLFAYSPQLSGAANTAYRWIPATGLSSDRIPNPVAVLNADQAYLVEVHSSFGCTGTTIVHVSVMKESNIYVPTGFTPDHDGFNDVFKPVCVGITSLHYFKVFNRWGKQVYSTTTQNEGWDGAIAGVAQPAGAYAWMVQGVTRQGKIITKTGTILLIR